MTGYLPHHATQASVYFRFNPFIDNAFIDEHRPARLEAYKTAAHEYIASNAARVDE